MAEFERKFKNGDIKIINGECIDVLKKLKDNSIDCCITDPPYFIDKLDNKWNSHKMTERKTNSHIKHLPTAMKYDKRQVKNLYIFYTNLFFFVFPAIQKLIIYYETKLTIFYVCVE